MRRSFALILCWLAFAPSAAIAEAAPKAAPKPAATPARPVEAQAVAQQRARVELLARTQMNPAYPEALVELAKRYHAAGEPEKAVTVIVTAAEAFDKQVEIHKALSEVVTTFELSRAERTAARKLALQRDEAFFLAAEWSRQVGQTDMAIRHYATVVQSQPDQPLGEQALAALVTLGFVVPPPPKPSPSPSAK